MTLSDLSIRNPVFAWMLMAALIVFGAIGYTRLGVSEIPEVDFANITVTVNLEGASPEIMESDIADVLEDALSSISGITEISSTNRQGECRVSMEFDLSRDIDAAFQDVQAIVAQAVKNLPRDIDPPILRKSSPLDHPILWVALSGMRPTTELSDIAKNQLKDRFQALPGVGDIQLGGFLARNVRVWLDATKIEALGLTVSDVDQAIRRQHVEIPAGRIETSTRELNLRSEGEVLSLPDLRRIVVSERGGAVVRLGDVAVVQDGLEDMRRVSRFNGRPAIGMGIKKQIGANAVAVARAAKVRLEEIRRDLPKDLSLEVSYDGTAFVEESIREVLFTLVFAAILTSLVCWLFLGSFTSTLNVLLSIPTSIIGTFAVMYFCGFTLNLFTLLGLSLSVGIIVDDTIMVMENIFRHAEAGKPRREAALVGAREITFAAVAATFAIVAIFLPVAFMKGMIGRMFFEFGVTISVAVLLSLLEAVTLTPSRCSQFLDVGHRTTAFGRWIDRSFDRISRGYRRILAGCLAHKGWVLGASAAVFAGSLFIARWIGQEFIPAHDQSRFLVRLETPIGTSIEETDRLSVQCEGYLMNLPEVLRYYMAVGGFGGGEVNVAQQFVTLTAASERRRSQGQVIEDVRNAFNRIPGLRATVIDLSRVDPTRRGRSSPVEFSVRGKDWGALAGYSSEIMKRMAASGRMADVDSDYRMGQPEVKITPLREKAADLGVSMEEIGRTINALIGGVKVAKFKDGGRRYDVRLRLLRPQRLRPEDVERLSVRTQSGELVRLSDLVRIEERPALQSIIRRGRERAITVTASISGDRTQAECIDEVQRIAQSVLPGGYRIVLSGSSQSLKESVQGLMFALWLGIAVAYMILASQFNSFLHPVTVLLALPFSVTGALLFLLMTGYTLNLYSMIGLILLMGIVKKNSILLVDYTNQVKERGLPTGEALLEACPVRLRPILMTSASTIAGAIPAALALGPGGELRAPMAVAVIGGMTLSAALTLFVVPCAYGLFDAASARLQGLRRGMEKARVEV